MAESIISHRVLGGSGVHLVTAAGFADFRRLGRWRSGSDFPLIPKSKSIFRRTHEWQERDHRIADRADAEILVLRRQSRIAASLTAQVRS